MPTTNRPTMFSLRTVVAAVDEARGRSGGAARGTAGLNVLGAAAIGAGGEGRASRPTALAAFHGAAHAGGLVPVQTSGARLRCGKGESPTTKKFVHRDELIEYPGREVAGWHAYSRVWKSERRSSFQSPTANKAEIYYKAVSVLTLNARVKQETTHERDINLFCRAHESLRKTLKKKIADDCVAPSCYRPGINSSSQPTVPTRGAATPQVKSGNDRTQQAVT